MVHTTSCTADWQTSVDTALAAAEVSTLAGLPMAVFRQDDDAALILREFSVCELQALGASVEDLKRTCFVCHALLSEASALDPWFREATGSCIASTHTKLEEMLVDFSSGQASPSSPPPQPTYVLVTQCDCTCDSPVHRSANMHGTRFGTNGTVGAGTLQAGVLERIVPNHETRHGRVRPAPLVRCITQHRFDRRKPCRDCH